MFPMYCCSYCLILLHCVLAYPLGLQTWTPFLQYFKDRSKREIRRAKALGQVLQDLQFCLLYTTSLFAFDALREKHTNLTKLSPYLMKSHGKKIKNVQMWDFVHSLIVSSSFMLYVCFSKSLPKNNVFIFMLS